MDKRVTFAERTDVLAQALSRELEKNFLNPFDPPLILVPNGMAKRWLSLFLMNSLSHQIFLGVPVLTLRDWSEKGLSFFKVSSQIYSLLDPQQFGSRRRDLALHLAEVFLEYQKWGYEPRGDEWQKALYQRIFPKRVEKKQSGVIYGFNLDFLSPFQWEELLSQPKVFLYQFSPCFQFWTDLHTDRERRKLAMWLQRRGAAENQLEEFKTLLEDPPSLLRNWGKLDRDTAFFLEKKEIPCEEGYTMEQENSLLGRLQATILSMENHFIGGGIDPSLSIFSTGASRLHEIEEIGKRIASRGEEKFSDILVLTPNLDLYAPFIELVFTKRGIPYTLFSVELGGSSLYLQGLRTILSYLSPRGSMEDLKILFSNPCFFKKMGWDSSDLSLIEKWLQEENLDSLLDGWIFLCPEKMERIELGQKEKLASFVETLEILNKYKGAPDHQTLLAWAEQIETLLEELLVLEDLQDADVMAQSHVQKVLRQIRLAGEKELLQEKFPLDWIRSFFMRPVYGNQQAGQMHGVVFAPFSEGAFCPAEEVFWIGMDEESFPRSPSYSSLDLLRKDPHFFPPTPGEKDRALLLRALFGVKKRLTISYGNLSREEGRSLRPSLLIEEIFRFLEEKTEGKISLEKIERRVSLKRTLWKKEKLNFPLPQKALEEETLSIRDLKRLVRHPWRFFLEKKEGIRLEKEEEDSFFLTRARLLRKAFTTSFEEALAVEGISKGLFREALWLDAEEVAQEWKKRTEEWGIVPAKLFLLQSCRKLQFAEEKIYAPAIQWEESQSSCGLLKGEIEIASEQGAVHLGKVDFEGMAKAWPEILATLVVLGKEEIFCIQTGEVKKLGSPPKEALGALFSLCAEEAPFPLLLEWISPFLKKKWEILSKKREVIEQRKGEDPVYDWMMERYLFPSWETIEMFWGDRIEKAFRPLENLFPSRKKREND